MYLEGMLAAEAIDKWSLVVGSVGLSVSIIGFLVALRQLRNTRTATEAATQALNNAEDRD